MPTKRPCSPSPVSLFRCLAVAVGVSFFATVAAAASGINTTTSTPIDHSKFEYLQKKFESGPEVTKACLKCHADAAKEVHRTKHWTWDYTNPDTGERLGKINVINNFCVSAKPNIEACSSCHVGYGWKDDTFDFTSEENVDCLVCHDTTGRYDKKALRTPGKRKPNLKLFAQKVGPTSRQSCGTCHFSGGGGKAVKHGDIDPSLRHPDFFVDVHMDAEGLNFSCSTCHTADQHDVQGSRYTPAAKDDLGIDVPGRTDGGRATCESCHGNTPHETDRKLNDHTDRVACQTCHIPEYSRGDYASKMWWDWSTAGKLKDDGAPFTETGDDGHEIYNSKKGDFRWRDFVVPEYKWFNGRVDYTLLDETIDPSAIVHINRFEGNADDPDSRIWPVKVMRGKQPYDAGNKTLVAIRTVGKDGFWKTFDWESAIAEGQRRVDAPYSGEYGFVETEMSWPITHMVSGTKFALGCNDCHAKGGRLEKVNGFYMPGRDSYAWLTTIGWAASLLTLIGVLVHMFARIVLSNRGR
jgi:octaheme c-type cytochrome (tetrathionate reductase family)